MSKQTFNQYLIKYYEVAGEYPDMWYKGEKVSEVDVRQQFIKVNRLVPKIKFNSIYKGDITYSQPATERPNPQIKLKAGGYAISDAGSVVKLIKKSITNVGEWEGNSYFRVSNGCLNEVGYPVGRLTPITKDEAIKTIRVRNNTNLKQFLDV
jgi:hypothetical protein